MGPENGRNRRPRRLPTNMVLAMMREIGINFSIPGLKMSRKAGNNPTRLSAIIAANEEEKKKKIR